MSVESIQQELIDHYKELSEIQMAEIQRLRDVIETKEKVINYLRTKYEEPLQYGEQK